MTIQRYSIGINVEKDDEADFCFYSDFIESLAEKESHLMLRNAIITHLEMVITERNDEIATLTAERDLYHEQRDNLARQRNIEIAENKRLREAGEALREYLIESSGDERFNSVDIPDEIWLPFIEALRGG